MFLLQPTITALTSASIVIRILPKILYNMLYSNKHGKA